MNKKIRIAFIKFGGLSAGGTEKFLQTIAANINKEKFAVDYYYCDSAPYKGSEYKHADTDLNRKKYLDDHNVNIIKFYVEAKDTTSYTHDWINTNFWDLFDESNYDIIQTGRAGHPEYPFNKIKRIPIIDSIHTLSGTDNGFNISRVMHITKWSAGKWIKMGGDAKRVVYVSHPMEISASVGNIKKELCLEDKFIFGFHQRQDDQIFSSIPLEAYKKIESDKNYFLIMGGSNLYTKQAEQLGIKNFKQLHHSANSSDIYNFLQTLSVYAHGRKDGELNSTAMAEAMYFGLPVVSHTSPVANGHIECIGNAGKVVDTIEDYSNELNNLQSNESYREELVKNAKQRFDEMYDLANQIKNIEQIYFDVIENPFPNKIRRYLFHIQNEIKKLLFNKFIIATYRKLKHYSK